VNFFAPALMLLLLTGCAGGPRWPDPAPDSGQLVVHLEGAARKGVRGPATEAGGVYEGPRSIEQGPQFERVDYSRIHDVIVILHDAPPAADFPRAQLTLTPAGFDRGQVLLTPVDGSAQLVLRNRTASPVTLWAMGPEGAAFELSIPARSTAQTQLAEPGEYEVLCEEAPEAAARVVVVANHAAWIGRSDQPAFFDALPPGTYALTVLAPRLPRWSGRAAVRAGERAEVRVPLSVNTLPSLSD
jgi:hypothetical protein